MHVSAEMIIASDEAKRTFEGEFSETLGNLIAQVAKYESKELTTDHSSTIDSFPQMLAPLFMSFASIAVGGDAMASQSAKAMEVLACLGKLGNLVGNRFAQMEYEAGELNPLPCLSHRPPFR